MDPNEFFKRYQYDVRTDKIESENFDSVYKAYDKLKQCLVMVRVVPVTTDAAGNRVSLQDEYEALKTLPNHPNVANYEGVYTFDTPQGTYDFAVLPYLQGHTLSQIVCIELTEEQRGQIASELLEGIRFLHAHRLLHCDLNTYNIYVAKQNRTWRPLISFGLGKGSEIQSLNYNAPEYLEDKAVGFSADLWSYGVILYEIMTGQPLFTANAHTVDEARASLLSQMQGGSFLHKLEHLSEPWREIAKRCLAINPEQRVKNANILISLLPNNIFLSSSAIFGQPEPPAEVTFPEISVPTPSQPAEVAENSEVAENEVISEEIPEMQTDEVQSVEEVAENSNVTENEVIREEIPETQTDEVQPVEEIAENSDVTGNEVVSEEIPETQTDEVQPTEEIAENSEVAENEVISDKIPETQTDNVQPVEDVAENCDVTENEVISEATAEAVAKQPTSLMDLVSAPKDETTTKPASLMDLLKEGRNAPTAVNSANNGVNSAKSDVKTAENAVNSSKDCSNAPQLSNPFISKEEPSKRKGRIVAIILIVIGILLLILGLATCSAGQSGEEEDAIDTAAGIDQRSNFVSVSNINADEEEIPARTTALSGDGEPCSELVDIEGNKYKTVRIGKQCWMKENLRTKTFADGTAIGTSLRSDTKSPAYYPQSRYGYLYNWHAVARPMPADSATLQTQGICPNGWHLPTKDEWDELCEYVGKNYAFSGDNSFTGKALASQTGWKSNDKMNCVGHNPKANNVTGFSATPAGNFCQNYNDIDYYANFWSSTQEEDKAYVVIIGYDSRETAVIKDYKDVGRAVRCLKD